MSSKGYDVKLFIRMIPAVPTRAARQITIEEVHEHMNNSRNS